MVARMAVLISTRASFLGVEIVRESRQRSGGLDGGRSRSYESVLSVAGEANTNAAPVYEKVELSSSKGLHPCVPFDASLLSCHVDWLRRRARGREGETAPARASVRIRRRSRPGKAWREDRGEGMLQGNEASTSDGRGQRSGQEGDVRCEGGGHRGGRANGGDGRHVLRRCYVGMRVCSKRSSFCGVDWPDVGCVWIQWMWEGGMSLYVYAVRGEVMARKQNKANIPCRAET
jgi:hypothetical protein